MCIFFFNVKTPQITTMVDNYSLQLDLRRNKSEYLPRSAIVGAKFSEEKKLYLRKSAF